MNNKKNKYLFKNTIIFSIGNFGSKFLNFLLVPLYTNILSTYQYGIVDLITIISMIVIPLFTMNISEGIMRFAMDKDSNKNSILNIGFLMIILTIFLSIFSYFIIIFFNLKIIFPVLICLFVISLASSQILMCYIRGIEKLMLYSIISIVQSLSIILLNIYFLKFLNMGVKGYLISYILSYLLTTLLCIFSIGFKYFNVFSKPDSKLFGEMVKYSILLIPNSLMWWIIGSFDKVMITNMINIESNGIYSISYKIPTILVSFTSIFNQAWMFSAVKEKDSKDKSEYTNSVFNALFIFILMFACFLMLFIRPITYVYVGKEFYESWQYVSPLLLGSIFLTLGTFISNEYTANKDSKGFLKSSTIGAICNLFLNFLLIPLFGIMGAAIATCISYIVVFNYRLVDIKKYVTIEYYSIKRLATITLALIISIMSCAKNMFVYSISIVAYVLLLILYYEDILKIIKMILNSLRKGKKI